MNTNKHFKNGNLLKLVAFFMIAFIIVYAIAFAAHGWQSPTQDPDSDDAANKNGDVDENTDGNQDVPTIAPTPEYLHYITGMATTKEVCTTKPLCFVFDSLGQAYGYSNAYLTIEIPTENSGTRLLCFMDSVDSLCKIGAILPTRIYMDGIVHAFGGVVVANGSDDGFDYSVNSIGGTVLDLSQEYGLHYTEYGSYVYSNGELMSAYEREMWNPIAHSLPYELCALGENYTPTGAKANTVLISFGDSNSTELSYSQESKRYTLMKNGTVRTDALNNRSVEYDNVFILTCDSSTTETSEFTKTVMNTDNGGTGYYISRGRVIKINWQINSDGTLVFLDESGEKLSVNRGTSYIAYVKSSKPQSIKIL